MEDLTRVLEPKTIDALTALSGALRDDSDVMIALTASIAVSLKRIADELCGNEDRTSLIEALFQSRIS